MNSIQVFSNFIQIEFQTFCVHNCVHYLNFKGGSNMGMHWITMQRVVKQLFWNEKNLLREGQRCWASSDTFYKQVKHFNLVLLIVTTTTTTIKVGFNLLRCKWSFFPSLNVVSCIFLKKPKLTPYSQIFTVKSSFLYFMRFFIVNMLNDYLHVITYFVVNLSKWFSSLILRLC